MAAAPRECQGGQVAKRDQEREKRLAEALRANLRRRKNQQRAARPIAREARPEGEEPEG